jgi:hypothetical protein
MAFQTTVKYADHIVGPLSKKEKGGDQNGKNDESRVSKVIITRKGSGNHQAKKRKNQKSHTPKPEKHEAIPQHHHFPHAKRRKDSAENGHFSDILTDARYTTLNVAFETSKRPTKPTTSSLLRLCGLCAPSWWP